MTIHLLMHSLTFNNINSWLYFCSVLFCSVRLPFLGLAFRMEESFLLARKVIYGAIIEPPSSQAFGN